MLIKDWEYWEDKLSMGHMALFPIRREKIKKEGNACNNEYTEKSNKIQNAKWIHTDKTGFKVNTLK
jgi:hypothetical protein